MQKRSSSRTGGNARVDGILRYRSANEGILCSARCRELSRTGLTATIERPVFPGDLLRFDVEPSGGGRSVMGLARVAWTGSDPEGPAGTQIMRIRFLSLGDTSEQALLEWLDELSDVSDPPSSPQDDSSVRALGRAIADSLAPPPPVLPGAPNTERSSRQSGDAVAGVWSAPAPIAVPNRPSIPPPPGLYTRKSRELTHSVENVGRAATRIAPPLPPPSTPPPPPGKRPSTQPPPRATQPPASMFPHPPSLFQLDTPTVPAMPVASVPVVSAPVSARPTLITPPPPAPLITPAPLSTPSAPSAAARRSAQVRQRLSRLKRADNTPLSVPVDEKQLLLRDDAPAPLLTAPPIALSVPPPLPLGALLNAPPHTTRRSSPPPANLPPPAGAASSSSWPALRVPPSIAALSHGEPLDRPSRATIPPPAEIAEMPPLRVTSPALEDDAAERVALPPHSERVPPRSDAPWSMPVPTQGATARPWLAICLGSLAAGAGLAYLVYGPSLLQPGDQPAAPVEAPVATAATGYPLLAPDDVLAPLLAVPSDQSAAAILNGPEAMRAGFTAKPSAPSPLAAHAAALGSKPQLMAPAPGGASRPGLSGSVAAAHPAGLGAAAPATSAPSAPAPVPELKEIEPGDKLPPPAPALPVALGGSAPAVQPQGSRLSRARECLARGDLACATELLRNAGNEPELELWIETLRAQGNGLEARRAMKRFVEAYPEGRRAATYRRILSNAQ